jgi:hypothetical protein
MPHGSLADSRNTKGKGKLASEKAKGQERVAEGRSTLTRETHSRFHHYVWTLSFIVGRVEYVRSASGSVVVRHFDRRRCMDFSRGDSQLL